MLGMNVILVHHITPPLPHKNSERPRSLFRHWECQQGTRGPCRGRVMLVPQALPWSIVGPLCLFTYPLFLPHVP